MTSSAATITTYVIGAHYEVTDGIVTKYYYAGSQRIAMQTDGTLYFMLNDHLGSTSLTTFANGNVVSELRYKAWGEVRYSSGTTPTQYQYTGQFSYETEFGLYFYNARMYDPALGRFTSADSIVPGGMQALDRYAYVNNSPIRYTDPSGHMCSDPEDPTPSCDGSGGPPPNRTPSPDTPDDIDANDPVTLTQDDHGYDGSDMYKLYLFYFQTPGWWHTKSFDPDGHFSILDFLVLMVFFEMNGVGDHDASAREAYTIATANNVSFFCAYHGGGSCSGISNNAILNYIAGREVARVRFDSYQKYLVTGNLKDAGMGPIRNGLPYLDNERDPSVARLVVENAIQQMSSSGSLMDYGNLSMFPESVWLALAVAPTGCTHATCVYWRSADNLAFVMTQEQINCWRYGSC